MEKKMNIRLGFGCAAALLIAMMFASCTKVEMEAPSAKFGGEIRFGITKNDFSKPATKSALESESKVLVAHDPNDPESFGLSMTVVDGIQTPKSNLPATKGAQITDVNAFDVAAYYFAPDQENGLLYFADQVSDGVNTTGKQYYWPMMGTMNFVATYPSGLIANGIQTIADDNGNLQPFSYTIPEDVTAQQDIMVAVTNGIENAPRSQSGAAVGLNFQHLLAAVQFKVGEMQFIKINSLKVTGVYGGEITFKYNSAANAWTPTVNSTASYDLSSIILDTSGLKEGDEITSTKSNSIMLVAPQTLPEGAQLEVSWTETITALSYTKNAPLSGVWEAGKTTVYALNIAGTDFGTVEIPRPDDQDAHYIMLTMSYNMGNILSNSNIKSVKATAQWKKDENGNDVSGNNSEKSAISLLFAGELSETQKQGFWTDKRYIETITVENGSSTTTGLLLDTKTDSHGNTGLRGGSFLDISAAKGDIVLFIEENNGTNDREGELVFTATLNTGVNIDLGKGQFKQLCPSWNNEGLGVERIETDNKTYAYGFDYTRKVVYSNPANSISWIPIIGWIAQVLYSWGASSIINDDEGDFITINRNGWVIESVTLDYGALSEVEGVANSTDGLANTKALYNFTGNVDIGQVELDFDDNLNWNKSTPVEGEGTPEDYAAFMALSRNRMYEKKTVVNSSEGNTTTYKAILYKDGATDLEGNDIIEWYLPSSVEAENLKETGVDNEGNQSVIDDLDGTYWSSTAGTDLTPAQANAFVFNANVYSSQNSGPKARTEKYKVRAVRKKPTAN